MVKHDVIVIGASAGGVEALSRIVAEFPREEATEERIMAAATGQAALIA
jgi:chemotaxis response regulator CheB